MVDPYNVIQAEAVGDSFDPPLISRVTVHFPVVQRVSPELSCFTEIVRGDACDVFRFKFFRVYGKYIPAAPCIGAVV